MLRESVKTIPWPFLHVLRNRFFPSISEELRSPLHSATEPLRNAAADKTIATAMIEPPCIKN